MPRLVALFAVAACAGHPPPVANHATATHYTITPIEVMGGEGLHSASHSQLRIAGRLDIEGERATLALDLTTDRSWVHCNFDGVSTLQACAPPDAKDQHATSRLALAGTVTRTRDTVAFALGRTTLTCRDAGAKLACTFADDFTLFGPLANAVQLDLVR